MQILIPILKFWKKKIGFFGGMRISLCLQYIFNLRHAHQNSGKKKLVLSHQDLHTHQSTPHFYLF